LGAGATLALVGSGVGRVVNFVGQVVLARWLGPAALGLYALGWGAFRLLTLPATLGINNGVQHFGSICRKRGGAGGARLLRRAMRVTLACGAATGLALLAVSPWLAERLSDDPRLLPVLQIFAVALPFAAMLRVGAAATRVRQDLRASVVLEDFGQPFLFSVLAVVLLAAGGGVLGAALASGLSFVLVAFPARVWAGKWFPRAAPGAPGSPAIVGTSGLVRYSVPTALAGTIGVTMTWLDRLLVGYYLPTEAVGWYQVAAQASGAFAVVLGAFNAIFAPMIAGLLAAGERAQLQELYRVATKWGMLAVLPGAALCLLFPEVSIEAIFGDAYQPAAAPLVILVLGQLVTAATGAVGYLLMMGGRQNPWLALSLAALAADCVLNVLLIPRFGLEGAAAATTISVALLFAGGLWMVRAEFRIWPYDRRFLGVLATAAGALGGSAALRLAPSLGSVTTIAAVVIVASLVTLAGWRVLCFGDEDRLLLARLRRLGR
jgi:O-antigen/teichoic acid export membrane protein